MVRTIAALADVADWKVDVFQDISNVRSRFIAAAAALQAVNVLATSTTLSSEEREILEFQLPPARRASRFLSIFQLTLIRSIP